MKKIFTLISLCFACCGLFGKATVMFVSPAGGKQGTKFGAFIGALEAESVTGAVVSGGGVKVEIEKVTEMSAERTAAAAKRDEAKGMKWIWVEFTIDADAAVGMRDLRLISPDGASNRFRFFVGEIDEISEKDPNETLADAQQIHSLPVCINGQIYEADKDFFRFKFNKGQTIVLQCFAREIKPYIPDAVPGWFQPSLTLYDEDGRMVSYVDDYKISPDPVMIFNVQKTGYYYAELKDAMFRGRDDFVYRLRVGELPFIDAIFPNGGQRGKNTEVMIQGVNLQSKKAVISNKEGAPVIKDFGVKNGKLFSNLVKFDVDDSPETIRDNSDEIPPLGDCVIPPAVVNGRIKKSRSVDWVRVKVEEPNTVLVFETMARRLGSAIDTKISVYNPEGTSLLNSNDDYEDASFGLITHHADSRIQMRFRDKGEYLVKVEDAQSRGGFDYVYRLKIDFPKPDFRVRATPDNPQIAQGDYLPLKVLVFRTGGFEGDITVEASQIPKGYTAEPCVVEKGKNSGILKLIASADVPMDAFNPQFTASAVIDGKKAVRPVQASEELMQAFFYFHSVPVDKISISVTPRAPFKVEWGELPDMPFNLQAGGTHTFEVKVIREDGFKLPVRIKLLRSCPGMSIKEVVVKPDETTAPVACTVPQNLSTTIEDVLLVMGEARDGKNIYRVMAPLVMRYRAFGK